MDGCKCKLCFGLAEWCQENLGHDYGLPPAQGHSPVKRVEEPATVVTFPVPRPEPHQPWMPRKSRYAA